MIVFGTAWHHPNGEDAVAGTAATGGRSKLLPYGRTEGVVRIICKSLESVDQETWTLTDVSSGTQQWLARGAGERNAYLTTIGRQSGKLHRIEIWFAVDDGLVYLLSGGRDRSDWVQNLQTHTQVSIDIGGETHAGTARVLDPGTPEDQHARELLVAKYREGDNLDEWGRTSLPIVIEFSADAQRERADGNRR